MSLEDVDRLTRIINNLLDISKIEAGKVELDERMSDLGLLVQRAVTSFQVKAAEKRITLTAEMPEQIEEMSLDPDKVLQILINLIGNALKFTPEGKSITVCVLDSDSDRPDDVAVRVLAALRDKFDEDDIVGVKVERVANPNDDEFECLVCGAIEDIEDSILAGDQGLVCPACARDMGREV